jgi:undecaprenyl-diphosphatase
MPRTIATSRPPLVSHVLRRLELRLLLLFLAAVAALWTFLGVTGEVREGETSPIDTAGLLLFRVAGRPEQAVGPRWVQETARDITALGGFTVLTLLTVVAIAVLVINRKRLQAGIFAVTVMAAQAMSEIVKAWVDRPRPPPMLHHDLVYSSSFPSGHAMMSPVVYLTLAAFVSATDNRRAVKVMMFGLAVALVIAIGVSRVYLGVHWPSDVLAGWSLGSAVAVIATLALMAAANRTGRASMPLAVGDSGSKRGAPGQKDATDLLVVAAAPAVEEQDQDRHARDHRGPRSV